MGAVREGRGNPSPYSISYSASQLLTKVKAEINFFGILDVLLVMNGEDSIPPLQRP